MLVVLVLSWLDLSLALVPLHSRRAVTSSPGPHVEDSRGVVERHSAIRPALPEMFATPLTLGGATLPFLLGDHAARAFDSLAVGGIGQQLDPRNFQPVCPASDGVYRWSEPRDASCIPRR